MTKAAAIEYQPPALTVVKPQKERLMIVEDDPDIREDTSTFLKRMESDVIDRGDGSTMAEIATEQENGIDFLLTGIVNGGVKLVH